MMNEINERGREIKEIETPPCYVCGKKSRVVVYRDEYDAWKNGTNIQFAMPEMPADRRELLKTGIHPECWDKLFKEDEDDYED